MTSQFNASILPPATLVAAVSLDAFFVGAAHELGLYRVVVLDIPDPHSPAGKIADEHIVAAYEDVAALDRFGADLRGSDY